jgi:dolichol-phosphate mannosyltransferase
MGRWLGAVERAAQTDAAARGHFRLLDRQVADTASSLVARDARIGPLVRWLGFRRVRLEPKDAPFVPEPLGARLKGIVRAAAQLHSFPLGFVTTVGVVCLTLLPILFLYFVIALLAGASFTFAQVYLLVTLGIGGLALVGIGAVGEYIRRIYAIVAGRPRYVVADRAGDNDADAPAPPVRVASDHSWIAGDVDPLQRS